MDAYLLSTLLKNNLLNKKSLKFEHADFFTPGSTPSVAPVVTPNNVDNSVNITNINISKDDDEDEDEDEYNMEANEKAASNISSTTFLLMLLINSYAAYLSWDCNTLKKYPLPLKIVFSFFAFMFGSVYVLYYMLFKFDDCNKF